MSKQLKVVKLKAKEIDLETYFQRRCVGHGWTTYKMDPKNYRGLFDRIVLPGKGLVVFVELKREKGLIRSAQSRRLEELNKGGYQAYIVEGKEEVDSLLNWIENEVST